MATHTAAAAVATSSLVESLGYGNVKASVSSTGIGLLWAGCVWLIIEALGLLRVAFRVWILNETVEGED
jgi:hypothetical protein